MSHIVVIGAGVTGLTTALLLRQKHYNVTIIAKWLPGDMSIEYTSPWAGAHWRTMAPNDDKLLQEFDAVTYRKLLHLGQTDGEKTGIMIVPSFDYYDELVPETVDPWFQSLVGDFKFIDKDKLVPNAKIGHQYTTVLINAPHYLRYLFDQFVSLGGQVQRQALSHIDEAFSVQSKFGEVHAVVNCTGLQARNLGGVQDTQVFPTRGQTVIVHAPHIKKTITYLGKNAITYVIPRSNGTVILGGTAQKNDFTAEVNEDTIQDILKRTLEICPELKSGPEPLKVVGHGVGLRPSRIGGPRIENELRDGPGGRKITVTHAYGHGGFGYQASWGSSEHIVKLVELGLESKAKL